MRDYIAYCKHCSAVLLNGTLWNCATRASDHEAGIRPGGVQQRVVHAQCEKPQEAPVRTIRIEGMDTNDSVQRVLAALCSVAGVVAKTVTLGSVVIEADEQSCTAACNAISRAGFKAYDPSGVEAKTDDQRLDDDGGPVRHVAQT